MATRNIALVSVGAVTAAVALGWGFSMLGTTDPVVQVQDSSDPAWRVQVEEMKLAEAVGVEEDIAAPAN
jgi:hypothetical protein